MDKVIVQGAPDSLFLCKDKHSDPQSCHSKIFIFFPLNDFCPVKVSCGSVQQTKGYIEEHALCATPEKKELPVFFFVELIPRGVSI